MDPGTIHVLRASYAKSGLLRMVAHRDMNTQLRRLFLRAGIPMRWSEGFSPKPRFHFAPPLPLGVEAREDWIDVELADPMDPAEFRERVAPQCLPGLEFGRCFLTDRGAPRLEVLCAYAEWGIHPFEGGPGGELMEPLVAAADAETLVISKRNKKGKVRDVDVRPKIRELAAEDGGVRVVMGASTSSAEGPLGLFDFLRACLPDLEEHPLSVFRVERRGFLRLTDDGGLVPAIG